MTDDLYFIQAGQGGPIKIGRSRASRSRFEPRTGSVGR